MRNRKNYPLDWFDVIRPAALIRAKFKCECCGIKHRQAVTIGKFNNVIKIEKDEIMEFRKEGKNAYVVYLQIHHKDANPQNNVPENLMAVCPRCHRGMDKAWNRIMRIAHKDEPNLLL